MAVHQLDDTVGTRNPHALRWFCRCTIREDARSLAMPVCATASTRWPTDKAAADPPAAGVARQPGHGPDPDGRAAAAGGQPVPSGLTAAAVTNVPWRASSSCRPSCSNEQHSMFASGTNSAAVVPSRDEILIV